MKETTVRHLAIAARLRRQIQSGELKPGQPIPSYRALMELHDVTVGTVRQAIGSLQAEGLIQSIPGIGCVVRERQKDTQRVGIAVVGLAESPVLLEQLSLIHDELDRLGCDIVLRFVPDASEQAIATLIAWARRHDGILLRGRVPVRLVQALADAGVTMVLLGEPLDGPCPAGVSHVTLDLPSVVNLAVSHLMSLGHRRIALCSSVGTRYFDHLADEFRACAARYGLGDEASLWLVNSSGGARVPYPEWVRTIPHAPTAYIVEESGRATHVIGELQACGLSVPGDVSVLAIAAMVRQPQTFEGLSAVLTSTRELILRGTGMLVDTFRSGASTVRVEKVVASFLPGKTCRSMTTGAMNLNPATGAHR